MKKLFTLALCAFAFASAQAADVAVVTDGALQDGLVSYNWWNVSTTFSDANPSGEGTVVLYKSENGNGVFSSGIFTNGLVAGPLHSATLNFTWYCPNAGSKFQVRLTSTVEENYNFEVTEETAGKWNTSSISVAEAFPGVSKGWEENALDGRGYVFSIVSLEGNPDGTSIAFGNVYYSNIDEAWTAPEKPVLPEPTDVPTPAYAADAVTSLFSAAYTPAVTFEIGQWGQSTRASLVEIDGKQVYKLENFNYLGWQLNGSINVASCDSVCVDVFPATGTRIGFTPISPGPKELVKLSTLKPGEWNHLAFATEDFTGVDFADIFQVKFDQGEADPYYIGNVYFYNSKKGSGVANVAVESGAASFFNLQGQPVAAPAKGQVYIRVTEGKAVKVRF